MKCVKRAVDKYCEFGRGSHQVRSYKSKMNSVIEISRAWLGDNGTEETIVLSYLATVG